MTQSESIPSRLDRQSLLAIKAQQIAQMEAKARVRDLEVADYVEAHPSCVEDAKDYVQRFLSSERHQRYHWILSQWHEILTTKSINQIAAILRDSSPETQELRSSPPFCLPPSHK